jgi:hypothetical protein
MQLKRTDDYENSILVVIILHTGRDTTKCNLSITQMQAGQRCRSSMNLRSTYYRNVVWPFQVRWVPITSKGRFCPETHQFFGSAPCYPGKNRVAPDAAFERCAPFYGDETIHFVIAEEPFKR